MMTSKGSDDSGKEKGFRDSFPGQTHFPKTSTPLSITTVIVLIVLTIGIGVFIWWLKS